MAKRNSRHRVRFKRPVAIAYPRPLMRCTRMPLALRAIDRSRRVSVAIAGGLLLAYRRNKASVILLLSGIAGVYHGYAYGEAVVGSETTPIMAYLFGFAAIQFVVISLAGWGGGLLIKRFDAKASSRIARIVGASVTSIGLVFLGLAAG